MGKIKTMYDEFDHDKPELCVYCKIPVPISKICDECLHGEDFKRDSRKEVDT